MEKARIRINFYRCDKGLSVSFQQVFNGIFCTNHFWNIDDFFNWYYTEQHLM